MPGWLAGWPWLAVCLAGWLAGLAGRPARQLWILVCKTRCKNPVDFIKSDVNPPVDLCVKNAVDFCVDFLRGFFYMRVPLLKKSTLKIHAGFHNGFHTKNQRVFHTIFHKKIQKNFHSVFHTRIRSCREPANQAGQPASQASSQPEPTSHQELHRRSLVTGKLLRSCPGDMCLPFSS